MADDNFGFCPHCGENIKTDATFCPACGTVLKQEAVAQPAYQAPSGRMPMSGLFLFAFVLLVLYAIVEVLGSFSLLTFNSATYDMIDEIFIDSEGVSFAKYMSDLLGIEITKDIFLKEMTTLGLSGLMSGILAVVSAVFCKMRKNHMIAVGTCAASTIVAVVGTVMCTVMGGFISAIPTLIVGLLVTFMIYSSKRYFTS